MKNFAYRVVAVMAGLALLTGCEKTPQSNTSSKASTAATEQPPLAAQTLADRMMASGFAPDQDGFAVLHALVCDRGKDDKEVVLCHASFADGQRDGQPAFLEIQLFDRDMKFAPLEKPLKDHVAGLSGRWSLDIDPSITLTTKSTGEKAKLNGDCHQSLGNSNSPAFCAVLFTPRIFIITGVKPAHSSTTHIIIAPGDGPDPNAQDINHAKELAILVIAMIGRSL